VPETVVINQGLDVAGPAGTVSGEARSEGDWKASVTPEAWAFHDAFIAGPGPTWEKSGWTTVPSPTSASAAAGAYGRRCGFAETARSSTWPDPDGLRGEQQSPAMDEFSGAPSQGGLETSWQPNVQRGSKTQCPSGFERQTSPSPSCKNCSVQPSRSWLPGPCPGQNGTSQPATDATTAAPRGPDGPDVNAQAGVPEPPSGAGSVA